MQFRLFHRFLPLTVSVLLGALVTSPVLARNASGPRDGLPGRRVSGGSRLPVAACVVDSEPLVALVPETNIALVSETASTLWFHLPEVEPSRQLEFKLYDTYGQVYKTELTMPETPGLVGVDVGALARTTDIPTLEVGQAYLWTFAIVCDPSDRSEDHWVRGWIEPVAADVTVDDQDWLVAVSEFIQQAQLSPQTATLRNQWQGLIESAGLEQTMPATLARAPITLEPTFEVIESRLPEASQSRLIESQLLSPSRLESDD